MNRYIAQTRLNEIGKEGQERLWDAKVLIVGCGALGSPIAMYLAGAGVGHIVIADFDTVDISNLHRQVFYSESESGFFKADCLKEKMRALNSEISIDVWKKLVTSEMLKEIDTLPDIIVDAADNPATTYMLDEYCRINDIPFSTAGVSEWNAQIFFYSPGSASYSDIFPEPGNFDSVLPCSLAGIVGPVASFAASIQAADVIKFLTDPGKTERSRLIIASLLSGRVEKMEC